MNIENILESICAKTKDTTQAGCLTAKAINGEKVERLPLIFMKPYVDGIPGKTFSFSEQFYNKEKMLYGHLEEIFEVINFTGDAQLTLRPNFGTIFIPSMFGLSYRVFDNQYPWITSHLTKQEAGKINVDKILEHEFLETVLEYIDFFKKVLPPDIHVYQPDTQGPFDIAHMIYGDELFYEIYDDEQFVLELMGICTEVFIKVSKILKQALGEKESEMWHGHALARGIYMNSGGVRVSEDSVTLISPEQIEKFAMPFINRALAAFGGGFVHFCGKSLPFLSELLKSENVRAVNLGNPEMYDFEETMSMFISSGKCCFGAWPKMDGEGAREYSRRMNISTEGGTKGLVLHLNPEMFPKLSEEEIFSMFMQ